MKEYRYYQNLCNAILSGKFNPAKYNKKKQYHEGTIALKCWLPEGTAVLEVQYTGDKFMDGSVVDAAVREIQIIPAYAGVLIDGFKHTAVINILYLYEEGITLCGDRHTEVVKRLAEEPVWEQYPESVELETSTDGGEDMIIDLEEPTREQLESYINNFDIDYEVSLWWHDGRPGDGVPFSSMKDHIRDYEKYLKWLRRVAKYVPY